MVKQLHKLSPLDVCNQATIEGSAQGVEVSAVIKTFTNNRSVMVLVGCNCVGELGENK